MEKTFHKILKWYIYLNILSIDVAIGACVMAFFVASVFSASISFFTIISLGMSVWIIYTIDHLKDALGIDHLSHTQRHRFHQLHFKRLTLCLIVALPIQIFLLFKLPFTTLLGGIFLVGGVVLYYLILWLLRFKRIYHKEVMISIIYTCGIFLPTFSIMDNSLSSGPAILFIQIALLAFSNLLIFSLLEMRSDDLDNQPSLALIMGESRIKTIIYSILLIGIACSAVLSYKFDNLILQRSELIILLMNFILMAILVFKFLRKEDRFRYVGDSIFYLPLLHFLWV